MRRSKLKSGLLLALSGVLLLAALWIFNFIRRNPNPLVWIQSVARLELDHLKEPLQGIRLLAESNGIDHDSAELKDLLIRFPEAQGAQLKNWILVERQVPESENFDARPLAAAFEKAFGLARMEIRKGPRVLTEILILKMRASSEDPRSVQRILDENKMMVVLPWNMWLRAPWDPLERLDDPERRHQKRRRWVADQIEKLPANQRVYAQNIYRGPFNLDPKFVPPLELKKLFPPKCPTDAKQKNSCISLWNIKAGAFLGQLPLSEKHVDPEFQTAIPEFDDLKYWGTIYIETASDLGFRGSLNFARIPEAARALINYLEDLRMHVELLPEWHFPISK